MSESTIELTAPTNRTVAGPKFHSGETPAKELRQVSVEYDYERDNGTVEWAQIVFEEVLAFDFRQNVCIRASDVLGSREVRCLSDSDYLSEVLDPWNFEVGSHEYQKQCGGAARFRHFTVYFDDAGSINAVASSCRVSPSSA